MFAWNGFERQARKSAPGNSLTADSKGVRDRVRSVGTRSNAFLRSGEDGQALVEFVLVTFFVLLPLLTGIFTCGIAYSNKLTLTNAVNQAAATLQVSRAGTSGDPCAIAWTALTGAAPGLKTTGTNPLTLTITFANGTSTAGATSCGSDWTTFYGTQNLSNTVTAQYPCNLAIYGMKIAAGCTITAQVSEFQY